MSAATLLCEAGGKHDKAIHRAAEILRRGGVVVFPTETVYGVGASVSQPRGVERLRELKGRDDEQPFTVHVAKPEDIWRFVDRGASLTLDRMVDELMPGPLTVIVDVPDEVIDRKVAEWGLHPSARKMLYSGNTIGLRCPDDPVARGFIEAVGEPVVASSANRGGEASPLSAEESIAGVGEDVDLVLDGGPCRYAGASTIVRLEHDELRVVRKGYYDQRHLDRLMQRFILFVCSGNTCRSPMAEAIAKSELVSRYNVPAGRLSEARAHVFSAGAFAMMGAGMTPEACDALKRMGVEPHRHNAQALTGQMIRDADHIYCMTETHRQAVEEMCPDVGSKVMLLDPSGCAVEDPIGAGLEIYVQCAKRMQEMIRARLDETGFIGVRGTD